MQFCFFKSVLHLFNTFNPLIKCTHCFTWMIIWCNKKNCAKSCESITMPSFLWATKKCAIYWMCCESVNMRISHQQICGVVCCVCWNVNNSSRFFPFQIPLCQLKVYHKHGQTVFFSKRNDQQNVNMQVTQLIQWAKIHQLFKIKGFGVNLQTR